MKKTNTEKKSFYEMYVKESAERMQKFLDENIIELDYSKECEGPEFEAYLKFIKENDLKKNKKIS